MRRVLLFAAFLLLLGLTTATAASFDVQAEDITSFSTSTTIVTPPPPVTPPRAVGTFYLIGAAPLGVLERDQTVAQAQQGVKSATFLANAGPLESEAQAPKNNKHYYVTWESGQITSGIDFQSQKVAVFLTRTNGDGDVTMGLFDCADNAPIATTHDPAAVTDPTKTACFLFKSDFKVVTDTSTTLTRFETASAIQHTVQPKRELRVKIVNRTAKEFSLQWGYQDNNRAGRLEVLG